MIKTVECVCECESVGGVKHQRSTIQRSVTEANQRAASLGRGAVLRCSTPLQTEAGSTQRRQDVTLSRHVHPPRTHQETPGVTDEWKLLGHQT